MADVGLGQLITTTGRAMSRKLKDAVRDNHPVYQAIDEHGGKRKVDGGRSIVEEAKSAQNSTVAWVGEAGAVSLADSKVLDAAEFQWCYGLGAVTFPLAEQYKNSGGSDTKYIDLIGGKFEVLEDSLMNLFHAGMLSDGSGSGGLQLVGLAALVATTSTTGTVGGIDRSSANAAWFRNSTFYTSTDWSDGAVDAGNVKRFLDKGINGSMKNGKVMQQVGILGQTHFEYMTQAVQAIQQIVKKSGKGEAGFDSIVYRGIPLYLGNGINYSGLTADTPTRSYLLNVKPGGVNLVFHEKAEFDMLEPIQSEDQAAISRLMFVMAAMTIGGLAKHCWVGYD